MQQSGPGSKRPSGCGLGRIILLSLLLIFSLTSFVAFILAAVAAPKYNTKLAHYIKLTRGHPATRVPIYWEKGVIARNPMLYLDTTQLPFVFIAVTTFLSWIVPLIALFLLTTKTKYQGHRPAHYIFKIAAVLTAILLVIFYLSWSTSPLTFIFPFAAKWHSGRAAVIAAHITL
ncbi:hypothetical protein ACLX1H_008367 [Fusarium chlamydosporum]